MLFLFWTHQSLCMEMNLKEIDVRHKMVLYSFVCVCRHQNQINNYQLVFLSVNYVKFVAPLMAFCVRKQILILLLVKFVYQQQLQYKLQFHSKSCIENLVDSIMFFQLVFFLSFFIKKYILQMTCLILIGSKSGR